MRVSSRARTGFFARRLGGVTSAQSSIRYQHSSLVPPQAGAATLDHLERRDAEQASQQDAADRAKLPSKAYRPLSLRAREDIMDATSHLKEHIPVDNDAFGQRLDEFLLDRYPTMPVRKMRQLVEQGQIYRYRMNGKRRYARVTDRLERGELVVVPKDAVAAAKGQGTPVGDDASPSLLSKEDLASGGRAARALPSLSAKVREEAFKWVLFKNKHVIVLNKPSGVPINPGRGVRLNVQDMLPAWKFSNPNPPLLVHRLDQDTSGLLVLARHPDAQRMLARTFMRRSAPHSVYWGLLAGRPKAKFGRIRMHLEVDKSHGATHIVARTAPTPTSRAAIAEYVVNLSALEYASFVSFYPLTGQTGQIRVMAAHALGCPVLGDGRFGGEEAFPKSLASFWDPEEKGVPLHLHHRKIQLPYKNNAGEYETVTAPLPEHMQTTFRKLGWPPEVDDPLITT